MDNEKIFPNQPDSDIRFEKPTFIDPLTGLFNRYYLYEFLPQEIKKAQASNYSLGVFMLDIDNFKDLNDTYGHLAGDEILQKFSDFLKKSRRATDMVIRYAGDEFVILLPGIDRDNGIKLGGRLVEQVNSSIIKLKGGEELRLTISIGFSLCPEDAADVDKLLDLADKALYLSKEKGRNQICHAKEVTLETADFQIALDSFPCPVFIDRYDEMAGIKQIFEDKVINSGLMASAIIFADTGVGKSRLLDEFNKYAGPKSAIMRSKGSLKYEQEPYYLLAHAVDNYLSKVDLGDLEVKEIFSAISSDDLVEISKLLPQIEGMQPSGIAKKQSKSSLFKAMSNLLMAINKKHPLVFSFDDLQWADNASIEMLRYLIKYERKRNIFIAATVKKHLLNKDKESSLIQLVEDLHNSDNSMEVDLQNLGQRDTYEMIEAMFPGLKEAKELNNLVFDITKGNPAFIEEIFKSLAENRLMMYKDNSWSLRGDVASIDIPNSLEATIKKRLKNLDKETKELIVQAAVVGENFSVDLLKKIGQNNEGYIFEVMARAKRKHLVNETDKKGTFAFVNNNISSTLYNELDEEERRALHEKIGRVLEAEHSGDLSNIAADLSLHFSKADAETVAAKYEKLLRARAAELFSPSDIAEYLEGVEPGVETAGEKQEIILEPITKIEISRLIKLIQSAVKNFQLYPPGSSIRSNFVRDIHQSLNLILAQVPKLQIVESGNSLVINGRRFSLREIQEFGEGDFISLMVESNIKILTFGRGAAEDEVGTLLDNISAAREDRASGKDSWKRLIKTKKLRNIKIDEFDYETLINPVSGKTKARKKFEDAMIMDFLLGKADQDNIDTKSFVSKLRSEPKKIAEAMNKIAIDTTKNDGRPEETLQSFTEGIRKIGAQITKETSDDIKVAIELSKVISELDWKWKNKFIRAKPKILGTKKENIIDDIIDKIPAEEIADIITRSYKEGVNNPLVVKDFIDKALPTKEKKEKAMPLIEEKLLELEPDKKVRDCLTGKDDWKSLPLDKRIDSVLTLPDDEFELFDINLLIGLLEELLSGNKIGDAKFLICSLLLKPLDKKPQMRKKIIESIKSFLKKEHRLEDRANLVLEILNSEVKQNVYADILKIVKEILQEYMAEIDVKTMYLKINEQRAFIYHLISSRIFNTMAKRMDPKNQQEAGIKACIKNFISEMAGLPNFLETTAFIFYHYSSGGISNMRNFLILIGEMNQAELVDIYFKKPEFISGTFDGYAMRKKVSEMLKAVGAPAIKRLRECFEENKEREASFMLLELAGHLKDESLIESVEPFTHNEDLELRRQAVLSLAEVNTPAAKEILSRVAKSDKNNYMRALAERCLAKK